MATFLCFGSGEKRGVILHKPEGGVMRSLLATVCLFFLLTIGANAQSAVSISGHVEVSEGKVPVAGASVKLTNQQTDLVLGAFSDTRGRFSVKDIPAGMYIVKVSSVGYLALEMADVDITESKSGIVYRLEPEIIQKNATIVTASRVEQKALEAPAAVTVIDQRTILERPAQTPIEYLQGTAGVDQAQTGISQRNVNVRGFNNVFTGTLLILTDYRLNGVPSLRANIPYFVPATNEDIERIELVRGPGSALYGPNASQGVMNVITHSPFASQGTSVFMTGGLRSATDVPTDNGQYYTHIGARHAGVIGDRFGFKISGQNVNAWDWTYVDPAEVEARSAAIAAGQVVFIASNGF